MYSSRHKNKCLLINFKAENIVILKLCEKNIVVYYPPPEYLRNILWRNRHLNFKLMLSAYDNWAVRILKRLIPNMTRLRIFISLSQPKGQ